VHSPSAHASPGAVQVTPAHDPTQAWSERSVLGLHAGVLPLHGFGSHGFVPHLPSAAHVWPAGHPWKKQFVVSWHLASTGEHDWPVGHWPAL